MTRFDKECRPGQCQLQSANDAIAFFEKQLKEALQKQAEMKKRLRKLERKADGDPQQTG